MVRVAGRFLRRGAMPFTDVFAGIAVRDRDAAIEFYGRLLGARLTRRYVARGAREVPTRSLEPKGPKRPSSHWE